MLCLEKKAGEKEKTMKGQTLGNTEVKKRNVFPYNSCSLLLTNPFTFGQNTIVLK